MPLTTHRTSPDDVVRHATAYNEAEAKFRNIHDKFGDQRAYLMKVMDEARRLYNNLGGASANDPRKS